MWDYKYRKMAKAVEARSVHWGSNILLTTVSLRTRLALNGPLFIKASEIDSFTDDLNNAIKTSREIFEENR